MKSDTELTATLAYAANGTDTQHVYAYWFVDVVVAGQTTPTSAQLPTATPVINGISLSPDSSDTRFVLLIVGSAFGSDTASAGLLSATFRPSFLRFYCKMVLQCVLFCNVTAGFCVRNPDRLSRRCQSYHRRTAV